MRTIFRFLSETPKCPPPTCPPVNKKPPRVRGPSGVPIGEAHEGGYKTYRNVALYGALPIIGLVTIKSFLLDKHRERPPFVKYEFLRRRTKRFPWGDGQRSLFHNKHTNPLPDGYED